MVNKTSHLERWLAGLLTELRGRYPGCVCVLSATHLLPRPQTVWNRLCFIQCVCTPLFTFWLPEARLQLCTRARPAARGVTLLPFSENLLFFFRYVAIKKSSVPTGVLRLLWSTVWKGGGGGAPSFGKGRNCLGWDCLWEPRPEQPVIGYGSVQNLLGHKTWKNFLQLNVLKMSLLASQTYKQNTEKVFLKKNEKNQVKPKTLHSFKEMNTAYIHKLKGYLKYTLKINLH